MDTKLLNEIRIQTSRSSGPGGQHVNKTESKVELHWSLDESRLITPEQKVRLRKRLKSWLTKEGVLIMTSQATPSQVRNREIVSQRFLELIEKMVVPPKKRVATRPTRGAVERRLQAKKAAGEKKRRRGSSGLDME
jgi:ribosome-associated protein